ncbi:hypothetical protein SDC9_76999 [bioreactor metagenome]|uniref:Uncharacterized protein n=1 Tax=bioreactor metagenome TaxID=1076179 RepID=A0A644YQ58_9ZZZZ
MNDGADDPTAAVDLARVRKLLQDLAHPSPALVQMVELSQHDPKSGDILLSGEHERHRAGGSKQRGGDEGPARPVRSDDLRGARPMRSLPLLLADYADGMTQVQIAKKQGLHVQTVRRRLIEAGIDTRDQLRALTDEDLRAVRSAKGDAASFRGIARGLGVAHTTVTRSLARRHQAPESPSCTTAARPRTSPTSVRAWRSPWRTTSEIPPDQGKRETQTGPSIEMLGPEPGCLSSTFGNSAPKTKTLVNRLDRGVYEVSRRPEDTAPKDDRGPVVRTVETAQTFLTASEVDALVGDYLAGMSVKALAERYGIHRATVFSHLRRRNVPSRRPGLGIDEKAEAVRLARAGVSMRAIGRRMGVDRKAVRAALVESGLIVDEASDDS